jgi:hypothetical protein
MIEAHPLIPDFALLHPGYSYFASLCQKPQPGWNEVKSGNAAENNLPCGYIWF